MAGKRRIGAAKIHLMSRSSHEQGCGHKSRLRGVRGDVVGVPNKCHARILLDIPRRGSNPSKTVDTKKGYRARLDADGKLMRTDVLYNVEEFA